MARTRSGARARDGGRHRLRQDVASVRQRAEGRAARQRWARPAQRRQEGQLRMLTQPQVQRYSTESGLRDIMIAEKEVVLTFLLQTAVRARHSEPAGLQGLHLLEKN